MNVLITRAKLGMEVFSNFRADELELDASTKHGVRELKNFLKYAETGELDIPRETGREADSPFELEVMLALRENPDARRVEMNHYVEALKKVRPSIEESMVSYYERIHDRFKGGDKIEPSSYIGYR